MNSRPGKGKLFYTFVSDYIVLDLETTGLDPKVDSIMEVGLLRVRDNEIVDRFDSLVNPGLEVSEFISNLTGITNAALAEAPALEDVLPRALAFIGDDPIVGHNVSFDINFMYDSCKRLDLPVFKNDFIDTLRIARMLFPDLSHYRLTDLADFFGLSGDNFHRADSDIAYTQEIYELMRQYCLGNGIVLIPPKKSASGGFSDLLRDHPKVSSIISEKDDFDPTHPLFGQRVVFTGTLERMTRREAAQIVADLGGVNCDTVTKKQIFSFLGVTTIAR